MAKINIEWDEDSKGTPCLKISKEKGKLSEKEVYEKLEKNYVGRTFIHLIEVTEEPPLDYYSDGDCWFLYDIGELEELE